MVHLLHQWEMQNRWSTYSVPFAKSMFSAGIVNSLNISGFSLAAWNVSFFFNSLLVNKMSVHDMHFLRRQEAVSHLAGTFFPLIRPKSSGDTWPLETSYYNSNYWFLPLGHWKKGCFFAFYFNKKVLFLAAFPALLTLRLLSTGLSETAHTRAHRKSGVNRGRGQCRQGLLGEWELGHTLTLCPLISRALRCGKHPLSNYLDDVDKVEYRRGLCVF